MLSAGEGLAGEGFVLDSDDLAALVVAAPDGVVVVDGSGLIAYANTTVEQLFSYEPGELVGSRIEALIPERARDVHVGHREAYSSSPETRPMGAGLELTGRRRDGTEFPVDVSLSPTGLRDGLFVTAFVRDASTRKQADDALRSSEERFRLLVENVADHALYLIDLQGRVASWNKGAERLKGYAAEEIVGEPVSRFYTAEDRAKGEVDHVIEVAARDGSYTGEGWRVRKDGSRFRAHVSVTRLDDAHGNPRGFAKVTRDVTDAYRLAAIAELVQTLLAGAPTTNVLELTSRYAREIVDARLAWIVGPSDRNSHLAVLAASGEGAAHLTGTVVSDSSVAAAAMAQNTLISLPSAEEHDLAVDVDAIDGLGPTLFVPLSHGDRVLGVLGVAYEAGDHAFRDDEMQLVNLFADQAALALHTGQLRAELERLSLLEERERIARDLHDKVVQQLFATGMSLQASITSTAPPDLRERIEESVADLDDTIRSIRTTIFNLQRDEASTPASGARSQILDIVSEAGPSLGFEPTVKFAGAVDAALEDHVLLEVASTLREALANVARHAHARSVVVTVVVDDGIVLTVTDDGDGIPSPGEDGGRGMARITEGAERLGGEARFERVEGGGARLVWSVPAGA